MNSFSPVQKQKASEGMSFAKAVEILAKGGKVHKLEWEDKEYYASLRNEVLTLHKPDGKFYQWIVSYGDLTGDDYIQL